MNFVLVAALVCLSGTSLVHGRTVNSNSKHELEPFITNPFERERCFEDLGCFDTADFFDALHRPINLVPAERESINTRFALYTRKNKPGVNPKPEFIKAKDQASIRNSHFDAKKPIKVIVHGFMDTGFLKWVNEMGEAILKVDDVNIIAVDWSGGNGLPYTQATANTWVVGGEIALLLKFLQDDFGANLATTHIIGHSLGAHVAGYASTRLGKNIARISGLDPAEPYFQYMPEHVRLDAKDAKFVDVIHTDGKSILELGFGMVQAVGHLDFYPNNGQDQPGCDLSNNLVSIITDGIQEGIRKFAACNHLRAIPLFTESIQTKYPFFAHECDSYENYKSGKCTSCGKDGTHCAKMGYYADTHPDKTGVINRKLYLTTGSKSPFSNTHYLLKFSVDKNSNQQDEKITMHAALTGSKGTAVSADLTNEPVIVQKGKSYAFVVGSNKDLGKISSMVFYLKSHWTILESGYWHATAVYIRSITVQPLDAGSDSATLAGTSTTCRSGYTNPIKNKQTVTFKTSNC